MGNRETAIKNLKKKGADANPNGRPKAEWTWAGVLKKALEEAPEGDPRQYKELIAESLRLKAIEGDVQAIKEFGDRIDGKPKQAVDLNNSGTLEVTWKDENRS